MNPVRSVAWRFRTFLSRPAHDIEERAILREQAADAGAAARLDEAIDRLRTLQAETEASRDEGRRLFVALRTLIEDQGAEIAELRREVDGLHARGVVGSAAGTGPGTTAGTTAP